MAQRQAAYLVGFEPRALALQFLSEYEYAASPKTVLFYKDNILRVLCAFLEGENVRDVGSVSPDLLRRYMVLQANAGLAPATVSQRYQSAHRYFAWCVEQGYLDESPMARLRRPKLPDRGREAFSREQVRDMLRIAEAKPGWIGVRDRAILTVLLGTGARASELCGMQLRDIDFAQKRLTLHGKGSKDRRIPMGRGVFKMLRDWLRVRPATPHEDVWLTLQKVPLRYSALEMLVRHIAEYAGVEGATVHRWRHSFATEYYRTNRDILAVKALLGHSSVETSMRYLRRLGCDSYAAEAGKTPDEWLA